MNGTPNWITYRAVVGIHSRVIAEHGGVMGIHDNGLLESALARPINRYMYDNASVVRQAADYAYGLSMNHPFKERNELTAFIASITFLSINGYDFECDTKGVVSHMHALRAGELSEERLVDWYEEFAQRRVD